MKSVRYQRDIEVRVKTHNRCKADGKERVFLDFKTT